MRIWVLWLGLLFLSSGWAPAPLWAEEEKGKKKGEKKKEGEKEEESEEDEDEDEDEDKDKGPKFSEVIEDFVPIEGLFTLYRSKEEDKVFIEILPEQFDKVYLCSVTREQADGYYFHSSTMMFRFPFFFQRVGKKVFLVHKNVYIRADQDAAVHRAIERGVSNSIFANSTIEGQPHPERGSVLVDARSLFVHDVGQVQYIFGEFIDDIKYSFDDGTSYFGDLESFPRNTEVEVALNFKAPGHKKQGRMSLWGAGVIPDNLSFQHIYHYSLSDLPEDGFKPRLADDRVGHFLTLHQDYTSVLRNSPYIRYINRWRLEKAEAKFKLSPPKKPIVFWLENTIPVEYRAVVREGILLWNTAFERIGFKDAIVVKQQEDDAEWDPADARYSTVRWIVAPGAGYARGPSHTNPFSGEIYDADIVFNADMIRYVFSYYEEFARPVALGDSVSAELGLGFDYAQGYCDLGEGAARQAGFGWSVLQARAAAGGKVDAEEYLRQFIVMVMAHEVGHTLGLRHNFKASTIHRLDEVHDTELTSKQGITGSVMEYCPANIAPEGRAQGDYYQTSLGPYDHWAIEYAYKPIDADDPKGEKAALDKIAARGSDPLLPYGTDEDAMYWTRGIDPSATRWDLGDDPLAYYRDSIGLAQELHSSIEKNFEKKGERYHKMLRVFWRGLGPYYRVSQNATKYIGGIYFHRDHIGDPGGRVPFVPVPAARQREALDLLTEHILGPDAFVFDPELLNKLAPERLGDFWWSAWRQRRIDLPVHDIVLGIQQNPLNRLYDPILLGRLQDTALRLKEGEAFTLVELFSHLRQAVWAEVEEGVSVNSFRRNLQRFHLRKLTNLVIKPPPDVPEDACTLARVDLKHLKQGIERILQQGTVDTYTQAHLDESLARIDAALEAGIQRQL